MAALGEDMRVARGLGMAILAAASALWICGAPASAATAVSVETACSSTVSGHTITLTADCDTTVSLTVPDGDTLAGAGHTITAQDPTGGHFTGAVLTNAGPAMSLENLTVRGSFANAFPNCENVYGVLFRDASGSMTSVQVLDITQHGTCMTVHAVTIIATNGPRTVSITGSTVSGFQRTGLFATGDATVNVSHSTIGPPDLDVGNPGALAQNTVQYGSSGAFAGTGGTFSHNTVIGAAFGQTASSDAASSAMLLFHAARLTVSRNTFGGAGTDVGIFVLDSTDIAIAHNHIARTGSPDGFEDRWGVGVWGDDASRPSSTLTCNTFAGWKENLHDITQRPCILTTSLPDGRVGQGYSAALDAMTENPHPHLTWTVIHGFLPPGLTLHSDGTITGTPTQSGTFTFTAQVSDPVDGVSVREFTITIHGPRPVVSLRVTKTAAPNPGIAGQPITYTITVTNGGPDDAFGVTVDDGLGPLVANFSWTCVATAQLSLCPRASGSGSIRTTAVDVAAGGAVTFTLTGVLPVTASGDHANNTVRVVPPPGTVDPGCTPGCEATVVVPISPALPITGPDLMAEAVTGAALVAIGGLLLVTTWRRRRSDAAAD
jgi:uncharacterized repeat protein (TIGR01451 family)